MSNDTSRESLIAELRGSADLLQIGKVEDWDGLATEILQAADMLEADAALSDDLTVAYLAGVEAGRKQAQQVAVPDGWALVPVEPTPEMRKKACDAWLDCGSKLLLNKASAAVRSGVAAAPAPPAPPAPPAQQVAVPTPMTDGEMFKLWRDGGIACGAAEFEDTVRAVEAHHKIGAKP